MEDVDSRPYWAGAVIMHRTLKRGPFVVTGSPDSGEVGEGSLAPDRPVMPYINSSQFDFVASVA